MAEWVSGTAFDTARANLEWRASCSGLLDDPKLHVTPRPVVYQVAVDLHPGEAP